MLGGLWTFLRDHVPGLHRLTRLPRQLLGISPFLGDIKPKRVPIFLPGSGRPGLPFPHSWNFDQPLRILETYFWNAEREPGSGRHNRYLEFPGFAPVLVTRDPRIIRAITTDTGDRAGQFDRDTLPSGGIARATGKDTLLFANGATWRTQKKLAAPPFGKTTLFQPEQFQEFAVTFRHTVRHRLDVLLSHLESVGPPARVQLEPEIKAVMLEMLANNFFGSEIPYDQIRNRYVPALERVIDHIVRDTVINKIGIPIRKIPGFTQGIAQTKDAYAVFEQLTDLVLAARKERKGLWRQFKSDAPDEALRSNIKVFLAGALEATTSYACWAISHLARNPAAQEKVFHEVNDIEDYTPETLDKATYLGHVLDETLRLTPSLYFLPRRATADTWITTADGTKLFIPAGTHILLDVWHANRHEDHWGVAVTGYPALDFVPERWQELMTLQVAGRKRGFSFWLLAVMGREFAQESTWVNWKSPSLSGHSSSCYTPASTALNRANLAKASVSTKPLDSTLVELELRNPSADESSVRATK